MKQQAEQAKKELLEAGFNDRDADIILHAVAKGANPLPFARRAIDLRKHVHAGCPLS